MLFSVHGSRGSNVPVPLSATHAPARTLTPTQCAHGLACSVMWLLYGDGELSARWLGDEPDERTDAGKWNMAPGTASHFPLRENNQQISEKCGTHLPYTQAAISAVQITRVLRRFQLCAPISIRREHNCYNFGVSTDLIPCDESVGRVEKSAETRIDVYTSVHVVTGRRMHGVLELVSV
ncbi:hypothetical protein CBL_13320 [Carabus blaptoides fortunei]